ncbi:phosphonate ABC transporter, permease protein PhnE [Proteinivorax hydrogeniformans]|uniref:Phosphonate ABC transporter, permease protein PhnE n=1 Tax=Proteinivorax hydrogeniformans TaxID=1826727 RepID=A0AAU8HTF8_9FIRM
MKYTIKPVGLTLIILALFIYSGFLINFNIFRIVAGLPDMADLLIRMSRPNIDHLETILPRLIETFEMAIIGTVIGSFFSVMISVLVARNTAPSRLLSLVLNPILAIFRTIPSVVWAALLVTIFSIGKTPGIIALSITALCIGTKLLREQIEAIPQNKIASFTALGASAAQTFYYGIFPVISHNFVSVFFFILEINIRSATVLGFVGAGGIGQLLEMDLNFMNYGNLATIILVLIVSIAVIDSLSLGLRSTLHRLWIPLKSWKQQRVVNFVKPILTTLVFIAALFLTANSIEVDNERMYFGLNQAQSIVLRMLDFDLSYASQTVRAVGETFAIAVFATISGAFFALFLGAMTCYYLVPKPVYFATKFIINLIRTFPVIVTAIIFFRGVGSGPLAGALALSVYSTGVLAKLYGEILERDCQKLFLSLVAVGANPIQIFRHGLLIQSISEYISIVLYRLESNMRSSTLLGIVGAGGIGAPLIMNISNRNWERVGILLFGVLILVLSVEKLSYILRKKIS